MYRIESYSEMFQIKPPPSLFLIKEPIRRLSAAMDGQLGLIRIQTNFTAPRCTYVNTSKEYFLGLFQSNVYATTTRVP